LAAPRLEELSAEGRTDVPAYLYASGRCAVAHAYAQPLIDADDPGDLLRRRKDLPVIRALAEYAIEHDLAKLVSRVNQVSPCVWGPPLPNVAGNHSVPAALIVLVLVSAPPAFMATFTASSIGSLKGTSIRSSPCS